MWPGVCAAPHVHIARMILKNSKGQGRRAGEVVLHVLYVKEATAYIDCALMEAKVRGDSEINFIVVRLDLLGAPGHVPYIDVFSGFRTQTKDFYRGRCYE